MLCRLFGRKRSHAFFLLPIGICSLAFGLLGYPSLSEGNRGLSMLMGMLTGFGSVLVIFGLWCLLRDRFLSPEKRRQQAIEQDDERNQALLRTASVTGMLTAFALFMIFAFVFVGLGWISAGMCCIGALYVILLAYFLAHRYYDRRM